MVTSPPIAAAQAAQLAALSLRPDRPLLISDADEVLFQFMAAFVAFLDETGHCFDWSSFALTGNIRRRGQSPPLEQAEVSRLLATFYELHTGDMAPVAGAAEALAALSARLQIVVLSNIPLAHLPARRQALSRHRMDYPLIAGAGPKGPLVRALAEAVPAPAPVFFIDDGPSHHRSVARHAARVRRLHMIADSRLARLVGDSPDSHHRPADWGAARALIESELDAAGY